MKTRHYSVLGALLWTISAQSVAIAEELFYENCVDGKCQKQYLVGKEKIAEGRYKAKVMLLDYKSRASADADERYRFANVICDKDKPSVGWQNASPQRIDKSAYSVKVPKKRGKEVDEPPKKYDELTSLWKKVCHI